MNTNDGWTHQPYAYDVLPEFVGYVYPNGAWVVPDIEDALTVLPDGYIYDAVEHSFVRQVFKDRHNTFFYLDKMLYPRPTAYQPYQFVVDEVVDEVCSVLPPGSSVVSPIASPVLLHKEALVESDFSEVASRCESPMPEHPEEALKDNVITKKTVDPVIQPRVIVAQKSKKDHARQVVHAPAVKPESKAKALVPVDEKSTILLLTISFQHYTFSAIGAFFYKIYALLHAVPLSLQKTMFSLLTLFSPKNIFEKQLSFYIAKLQVFYAENKDHMESIISVLQEEKKLLGYYYELKIFHQLFEKLHSSPDLVDTRIASILLVCIGVFSIEIAIDSDWQQFVFSSRSGEKYKQLSNFLIELSQLHRGYFSVRDCVFSDNILKTKDFFTLYYVSACALRLYLSSQKKMCSKSMTLIDDLIAKVNEFNKAIDKIMENKPQVSTETLSRTMPIPILLKDLNKNRKAVVEILSLNDPVVSFLLKRLCFGDAITPLCEGGYRKLGM